MDCTSSLEAIPSCTLLIMASSALRWAVSSKRRALSSATDILEAKVSKSRRSDSLNTFSRSLSTKLIAVIRFPVFGSGTQTTDLGQTLNGGLDLNCSTKEWKLLCKNPDFLERKNSCKSFSGSVTTG